MSNPGSESEREGVAQSTSRFENADFPPANQLNFVSPDEAPSAFVFSDSVYSGMTSSQHFGHPALV
jgi:hypothetical protein